MQEPGRLAGRASWGSKAWTLLGPFHEQRSRVSCSPPGQAKVLRQETRVWGLREARRSTVLQSWLPRWKQLSSVPSGTCGD